MGTVSRHTADAVRAELERKPDQSVTELSKRVGIARPTIYKALDHLGAVKSYEYYPYTYRLPAPVEVT